MRFFVIGLFCYFISTILAWNSVGCPHLSSVARLGCTPFVYFSSRALHYLWNAQVIIKHIEHRYHKVRIDYRYIWQTPGTRSQKQGFATLPFDWCEFVPAQCLCQRMICWLNEAELKLFMLLREEQREVARSCLYIHMSILGICMKPESFSYIIYMHHFD